MKKIPLRDFCLEKSQREAAQIIGCSQSAVSQMIKSDRQVYITVDDTAGYGCIEITKPKTKKAA